MPAKRTAESPFPITRTWKRTGTGVVAAGEYTITSSGGTGFFASFTLRQNGERLGSFASQREAKTAVEMHEAGFGTFVRWFNIVKPGK